MSVLEGSTVEGGPLGRAFERGQAAARGSAWVGVRWGEARVAVMTWEELRVASLRVAGGEGPDIPCLHLEPNSLICCTLGLFFPALWNSCYFPVWSVLSSQLTHSNSFYALPPTSLSPFEIILLKENSSPSTTVLPWTLKPMIRKSCHDSHGLLMDLSWWQETCSSLYFSTMHSPDCRGLASPGSSSHISSHPLQPPLLPALSILLVLAFLF